MKVSLAYLCSALIGPTLVASEISYSNCDENSVPASSSASSLTPNTFHKICPGTNSDASKPLSQPICGDGTAFSFSYHKPNQRNFNKDKIIIEFQGGGACWDSDTCQKRSSYLTYPTDLDDFIGYSCSELNYGMENYGGYPINLLCATTIGDLDLSEYNYIFVPYCTQDVHMGDGTLAYSDDDGNDGSGVYHHGAHNMMGVFDWIYENFPNPSHVFLTGCSAGGTVLPVAYDLINNHYNSFLKGGRSLNINTIIDSAVYLTPSYFLEYGIDNWNPWTVLDKTQFPYNTYKYNINYSTRLWEHVLSRGSRKDQWGFVTHTKDPVSAAYWQAMGGGYGDDDNDNDDGEGSWSNDMLTSLETVQEEYSNVNVFEIDGQGHCSFGLQYALQEDGFDDFATSIISEQQLLRKTASSVPYFTLSLALGSLLFVTASLARAKNQKQSAEASSDAFKSDLIPKQSWKDKAAFVVGPLLPYVQKYEKCPITSGLFLTTSLYFVFMLLSGGFEHPLNNPSLGPPASTLSTFGINNPTLIVSKDQFLRLFTSNFLCSGILTYLIFARHVFKCMRHVEAALSSNIVFGAVLLAIGIGSNLVYTLFGEGASCGSIALGLGMNVFSIAMSKKYGFEQQFPRLWGTVFFHTLVAVTIFPFNSWIMIVAAMVIGALASQSIVKMDDYFSMQSQFDRFSKVALGVISVIYVILFIVIASNVPTPDSHYQYPYLTGCSMMYTSDLDAVLQDFGGGRRKLGDYDGFCAQFCVPHLIDKPFYLGVGRFTGYDMTQGMCEEIGYDEHVADKTITYFGYSLDIEAFSVSSDDGNNN
jgi:hypothetical protein